MTPAQSRLTLVAGEEPSRSGLEAPILPLILSDVGYACRAHALLHGISALVESGPATVILGPNGAGKSLLLRLCHGLLKPTQGTVVWQGPGAADPRHLIRSQAMVFQRPVMLRRSARTNIVYALAVQGVPRRHRLALADATLDRSGLGKVADRPARLLSGGEQQRLALARAWALRPQVLFLDEPTANLDPAAARAVEEIIRSIRGSGTKIVMTTHDLPQARRLGDDVLFLHQGHLIERASGPIFFARPRTRQAAAFIAGELL